MVDFIGIERIQELVARRGVARFIEELAGEIEADFRRGGVLSGPAAGGRAKRGRSLARLQRPGGRVLRCGWSAEAVQGADIVTTVTADKRNATILTPPMISAGMHLNAVGGDCPGKTELHPDILRRADVRVVVEYEPQSRIEGEIQQMGAAFPVIELAALLAA